MDRPDALPPPPTEAPLIAAPDGACDTHVHMLADKSEFPLWQGRVENPAPGIPFEDWLNQYRNHLAQMGWFTRRDCPLDSLRH